GRPTVARRNRPYPAPSSGPMVETGKDRTTSNDPWWFLSPSLSRLAKPELVFVTQWTWHEKSAQTFLWDGAADGSIRWYAEVEIVEDNPVLKTRAGLVTFNTAVNQGLWHPDYFSMDWGASEGIYTGPAILLRQNPEYPEQVGVFYDGRVSVRIVARLMRFHHGDVVRELCRRGLMSRPASEPAPSPPFPPPQEPTRIVPPPPGQEAPARQELVARGSDWPSAEQLGIAKAPKQKAILRKWPELCRRYPNTYNADKVRAGEVSGGKLANHVGDVDPDSARAFLRVYRAWLEQHS